MRSGGTDSLSKDIVVEGFSMAVGGKTLFDNADLRISHGQVCLCAFSSVLLLVRPSSRPSFFSSVLLLVRASFLPAMPARQ